MNDLSLPQETLGGHYQGYVMRIPLMKEKSKTNNEAELYNFLSTS
jgi:hypothetical protein